MATNNRLYWILFSACASVAFSFIAPFAIYAEAEGLSPAYAVFYRYILIVLVATPFMLIFARKKFKFTPFQFKLLLLQSGAMAVLNVAYMMSFTFIPLSLAVIIFFTSPIITLMVVPFVFGGKLSPIKVAIFFIAFLGLVLVVGPEFTNLNPIGISLAVIAAITSVIQLLCMSKLVKEVNPLALLYSVHVIAMVITFFMLITLVYSQYLPPPTALTLPMIYNFAGIVTCYVLGYGIFTIVAKHLEPATISFVANVEPILTVSLAIWLFNETLFGIQAVGATIVIGALVTGSLIKEKPTT